MPPANLDSAKNRDDQMKPGRPPRPASEPRGSEGSARNAKTLTDPSTGEPQNRSDPPRPALEDSPAQEDAPT